MNKTLILGTPYITDNKESNTSRLCCMTTLEGDIQELWYEVDSQYRQYLCDERADAFVVALVPYCMRKGVDIKCEGALSEQLYYQLVHSLIPSMDAFTPSHASYKIDVEKLDNTILPNANAVGTGFSGGIDSFHTIATHTDLKEKAHNLTHLTFFNLGASGSLGGEESRDLFRQRLEYLKSFSQDIQLPYVWVDSNINEFIYLDHVTTHTFRSFSGILALQKLFSIYYYSSGFSIDQMDIKKANKSSAYIDPYLMTYLATENIRFYITSLAENRIHKTKVVAEYPLSYKYLNVCLDESKNCNWCRKCIRTIMGLYAIGKLDLYSECFDLDFCEKKRNKMLEYVISTYKTVGYHAEIYRELQINGIKIPFSVSVRSVILRYLIKARNVLTVYTPVRKLYFKLKVMAGWKETL